MKQQDAQALIKKTFESKYDKERFVYFVKNLFNDKIEWRNKQFHGAYIKEAYKPYVKSYEQIGKYEDDNSTLDVLAVELHRGQTIERARTAQRNFVASYLKNKNNREAALVAFYNPDSEDWRFSFIKMQYSLEKKKDELTPAKRFSFLVGKNEKSHTAQKQLAELLASDKAPTLDKIEAAFNIEKVTKEFFGQYKQLFVTLSEHLEKQLDKNKSLRNELAEKHIDHVSFAKKLLGQIVFLYFLQKKGWLGVGKNENWGNGDKRFLRTLLHQAVSENKIFYKDYLQYLFYEALAEERRGSADPSYYKRFNCKIPFLNGGLFEADYEWESIDIKIPNDIFTNADEEGTGILDVFDRYNFTVKEDEPLEKEVAVDPEMLGKVFENLLEVKDRKSKGAFYTPREIVHYMCQESLINYLDVTLNGTATGYQTLDTPQTDMFGNSARNGQLKLESEIGEKVKTPRADIETFIREGSTVIQHDEAKESGKLTTKAHGMPESIRDNARGLDKALENIRICDPAIGSGAFPVGMMTEIVKAREVLTTYLKKDNERTAYNFKRQCIQECIYGVDIDHSAIDIAKLRLWLSLVVDEDDLSTVKPLPNLDYKIVEGNSLIGLPYETAGTEKIEKLKQTFFTTTDVKEKRRLKKTIDKEIQDVLARTERKGNVGFKIDFDFKLFFSEVFHDKKGFDIVIGNPPYVRQELLGNEKKFFETQYCVYHGMADVYSYFIERGITLLNSSGLFCVIVANKWMRTTYGKPLRRYLQRQNVLQAIDFGDLPLFHGATAYPMILTVSNSKRSSNSSIEIVDVKTLDFESLRSYVKQNKLKIAQDSLDESGWRLGNESEQHLLEKIKRGSISLGEYVDGKIYRGVLTGLNEAFIIDEKTKRSLIKEDKRSVEIIKPFLAGRDIERYQEAKPDKYLIFTRRGININDYPAVKNYLSQYKKRLAPKPKDFNGEKWDGRKEGSYKWYEIQDSVEYFLEFDEPKIIYQVFQVTPCFLWDDNGNFCNNSIWMIPFKDKVLLAILNSRIGWYLISKYCTKIQNGYQLIYKYFEQIPIKPEHEEDELGKIIRRMLIQSVDKILQLKKQDSSAETTKLERQIDLMVYHLYNLSYEEAKIIDPELSEEEFEKYATNKKELAS